MKSLKMKVAAAALVATTAAVGGTMAFGLWSSSGSGSGNAKALTAQAVTVTAATGAADLYPGFADGDVHFTVTNTNPYGITFTSATPGTVTSSNEAGCPAANLTVDTVASGLGLSVAANASGVATSIPDIVTLSVNAPNACQGVVFTIPLTLSGSQS